MDWIVWLPVGMILGVLVLGSIVAVAATAKDIDTKNFLEEDDL